MVLLQALQTTEKQLDVFSPAPPPKSLSLRALTKQETCGWKGGVRRIWDRAKVNRCCCMTFYTDLLIFHTVSIFYCILRCSQKLAAAAKRQSAVSSPKTARLSPARNWASHLQNAGIWERSSIVFVDILSAIGDGKLSTAYNPSSHQRSLTELSFPHSNASAPARTN